MFLRSRAKLPILIAMLSLFFSQSALALPFVTKSGSSTIVVPGGVTMEPESGTLICNEVDYTKGPPVGDGSRFMEIQQNTASTPDAPSNGSTRMYCYQNSIAEDEDACFLRTNENAERIVSYNTNHGMLLNHNSTANAAPTGYSSIYANSTGELYTRDEGAATSQICTSDEISGCNAAGAIQINFNIGGESSCFAGSGAATRYVGIVGNNCNTTESEVQGAVAVAWTATRLCCQITNDADCDATFKIAEDGTASSLTTSITNATATCGTGTVEFGATEKLSVHIVEDGGTSCAGSVHVGCQIWGAID